MNASLFAACMASALVSGIGAGIAVVSLHPDDTTGDDIAALNPSSDPGALHEELQGLRADMASMGERITSLEMKPVAGIARESASPEALSRDEDFEADLRKLVASMGNPEALPPAGFVDSVSMALETIREREQAAEDAQRAEREAQRLEERLDEMQEKLGLDPNQKNGMRKIMQDESALRSELFLNARESGDFGKIREDMRTLRDQTKTSLSTLLSPDQMEQYESMNDGRGNRGFGGFTGGGGGRGGRGGF